MGSTLPSYDYSAPAAGGTSALGVIIGLLAVYGVILFVALGVALVISIFQGIGLLKMHKTLGLKGGWMSFIPVLNVYAIGKIAEQYIKQDGKKSAKLSVILLISYFGNLIVGFVAGFFLGIAGSIFPLSQSILMILSLLIFVLTFGCSIAYQIVMYIAFWRIYALFSNHNATLLLILSIVIPIAQPIIVFVIRNNEPMCVELKVEETIEQETNSAEIVVEN